jgi:hypothetical protein
MCFVTKTTMFLTAPTIGELQKLDIPTLLDMLAYQTGLHFQLLRTEGISSRTDACKDFIRTIQAVIENKKKPVQNDTDSAKAAGSPLPRTLFP